MVNPSVQDKNSDGTTNAVIEYGVDGIVNGDKIDVGYAAEFEDGAVGENVKVISDWWINGEDSGNYNIVSPGDLYGNIGTPIEILSKWGYVLFINNDDNRITSYNVCYTKLLRMTSLRYPVVTYPKSLINNSPS